MGLYCFPGLFFIFYPHFSHLLWFGDRHLALRLGILVDAVQSLLGLYWVGTSHKNYGGLTVVKENGAVMSCDCLQIPLTVFSKCSPSSVFFFHT